MSRMISRQCFSTLLLAWLVAVWGLSFQNEARAVSLNLNTGALTINTDTLLITGAASATGVDVGGVATFNFDSISLTGTTTVNLVGSRPLSLRSNYNTTIGVTMNFSGNNSTGAAGATSRLGGGAGSSVGANTFPTGPNPGPGLGIGGGGNAWETVGAGGGGGGFGGAGGSATISPVISYGGTTYGNDILSTLYGGSGGGGGGTATTNSGGGAGGGALELYSQYGSINITSTASLLANGGSTINTRSGGGGSGGAIRLDAGLGIFIDTGAVLSVRGGNTTGTTRSGGGGGGGRIAFLAPELEVSNIQRFPGLQTVSSILNAAGGLSGGVVGIPGAGGGEDGGVGRIFFTQTDIRALPVPEPSMMTLVGAACWVVIRKRRHR